MDSTLKCNSKGNILIKNIDNSSKVRVPKSGLYISYNKNNLTSYLVNKILFSIVYSKKLYQVFAIVLFAMLGIVSCGEKATVNEEIELILVDINISNANLGDSFSLNKGSSFSIILELQSEDASIELVESSDNFRLNNIPHPSGDTSAKRYAVTVDINRRATISDVQEAVEYLLDSIYYRLHIPGGGLSFIKAKFEDVSAIINYAILRERCHRTQDASYCGTVTSSATFDRDSGVANISWEIDTNIDLSYIVIHWCSAGVEVCSRDSARTSGQLERVNNVQSNKIDSSLFSSFDVIPQERIYITVFDSTGTNILQANSSLIILNSTFFTLNRSSIRGEQTVLTPPSFDSEREDFIVEFAFNISFNVSIDTLENIDMSSIVPLDGNFSVISFANNSIFTVQRMIRQTIRSENFYGLSSQFDDFKRDINTSIASLSFKRINIRHKKYKTYNK